jgi:hypothetical protein
MIFGPDFELIVVAVVMLVGVLPLAAVLLMAVAAAARK